MNRFRLLVCSLAAVAATVTSCTTAGPDAVTAHVPPCCATNVAPSIRFSDQSLYQIDSTWTNDLGRRIQLDALRGRIQVVAMFFASCTYACPIIVHDMQRIEASLPEEARGKVGFTLVTIDTERDTPEALHAFREGRHLPAEQWTILRGGPDDTLELAALLGVKYKREANGQFAHSNLITVLNAEGEIIHQIVGLNQDIEGAVKQIAMVAAK